MKRRRVLALHSKVEMILKGSPVSIPSPSSSLMKTKKFVDITQQYFALLPQVRFPVFNLNFHSRSINKFQNHNWAESCHT